MIVDDIENDFDAVGMKLVDHGLEFARERRPLIARFGREEGDGVIPPVIAEAFLDQIAVIDERMDGQQFGARDAERVQIGRDVRMGETGEGSPIGFGHQRV